MTTNLSIEILKSALLELAQADRAFFVSLINDLMNENAPKTANKTAAKQAKVKPRQQQLKNKPPLSKINPPYRKNVEALRSKYAMDKAVLLQLQDIFSDAPPAEAFLQSTSAR